MTTDAALTPELQPPNTSKADAMLDRLAAIGMKIAERLGEDIDAPGADANKIALDFARVARAVRQTLAMQALLADQAKVRAERERYEEELAREEAEIDMPWLGLGLTEAQYDARNDAFRREANAGHLVRRVIKTQYEKDDRESLTLDLEELLEDKERFFSDLPLSEVIAGICRDLQLEPDWTELTRKDWDAIDLRTRVELKAMSPPGAPEPALGDRSPTPEEAFADP